MICDNCGYEKNPDDALSCNLCGKVLRKEIREDRKDERKTYEFEKKKPRIYCGSGKRLEGCFLIVCILMIIFWITVSIIKQEPISFKDVFWITVGTIFLCLGIWGWLTQTQEEREKELIEEKKTYKDPTGVINLEKGICRIIKSCKDKETKKEWIFVLLGIVIVVMITFILDDKFDLDIKESLQDFGGRKHYTRTHTTLSFWLLLVVFGGAVFGGILLKVFQYITDLSNREGKRRNRQ